MRIPPRLWKWLGIVLSGLVVIGLCVWTWVIPAVIVRQLQARVEGHVSIGGWWIDGSSAGVTGLRLHEGAGADSPVWAKAERVATDLSLGGLFRGKTTPGKLVVHAPDIAFRLDADGKPLTRPAMKGGKSSGPIPEVVVEEGRLTIHQDDGRPELVVTGIGGRLVAEGDEEHLALEADDPTWGKWKADGRFTASFQNGRIDLSNPGVNADPKKVSSIPFVPRDVWNYMVPTGLVDVLVAVRLEAAKEPPIEVHTEIVLKRASCAFRSLGLASDETTGRIVVDGGKVRVMGVEGASIGGHVKADGSLDFTQTSPRIDLSMKLDKVDITQAPKSWQLDEVGVTAGRLTGETRLKAVLNPNGVDLSGSSGDAVIEGGMMAGFPIKSLKLSMQAEGNDLKYDAPKPKGTASSRLSPIPLALIALQAPRAADPKPKAQVKPAPPVKVEVASKTKVLGGIHLPKSISTQIELEDVDLKQVVARAEAMGIRVPVGISGRLSIKADATIPLGALRDVKEYVFHGDASLSAASIDGVDLGRVLAKLDLKDGVLELTDFRGVLVDLPAGGIDNRPPKTEPPPAEGPLPVGGFRIHLRAELSPPGRLTTRIEGNRLPIGELAAPALPRPTPLSGTLTLDADAETKIDALGDPKSWTATGHARSERIAYLGSTFDAITTKFALEAGRLELPDFAAKLSGKPLTARLRTDLAPPYTMDARLDVTAWDLSDLLAFVPGAPKPAPVDGSLTGHFTAKGTLSPRDLTTSGEGRVSRFQAGSVPLGELPFEWSTQGDVIVVGVHGNGVFGGKVDADAHVPARGEGATSGSAVFRGIDTAAAASLVPGGGLKMTGKASGKASFSIPAKLAKGAPAVEAKLSLTAPDLTIQDLPASGVTASIRVHSDEIVYEAEAESLGGKIKFKGNLPLGADPDHANTNAQLRAIGFSLGDAWKPLGLDAALGPLHGEGAVVANVRSPLRRPAVYTRAIVEARDLVWGKGFRLGRLHGIVAATPAWWRIEPIDGDLLGGSVAGSAWGEKSAEGITTSGFNLAVDRIGLHEALAFLPSMAREVRGTGSLQLTGRIDNGLQAHANIVVPKAVVYGLPLSELHVPAELSLPPGGRAVVVARRLRARLAGGRLEGDARVNLGHDRSYQITLRLADVDLEAISRVHTDSRSPASGRIGGKIAWHGRDPAHTRGLAGKMHIDLTDASLFELPVFKQMSRFLGAAQGGAFEDGNLDATIGERGLTIDQLTLEGKLVQLHVTGTVGYDAQLNLNVLVNTNQIISESGQALVGIIPGLGGAAGRRDQAVSSVGGFLSNRLIKLRVSGTIRSPQVNADPAILVTEGAVGFFGAVLKLPFGILR